MKRVAWMFAILAALGLGACGGSTGSDAPVYSGMTAKASVEDTNVVAFAQVTEGAMRLAFNADRSPFGFWYGGINREAALELYTYTSEIQYEGDCGGTISGKAVGTFNPETGHETQSIVLTASNYCNGEMMAGREAARPDGEAPYTDGMIWNGSWTFVGDFNYAAGLRSEKSTYQALSISSQDGMDGEFYNGSISYAETFTPEMAVRTLAAMDPNYSETYTVDILFRGTEAGVSTDYLADLDIVNVPDGYDYLVSGRVYVGDLGYADVGIYDDGEGLLAFGMEGYFDVDGYYYYTGPSGGMITFNATEGALEFTDYYDMNYYENVPNYYLYLGNGEGGFTFFNLYDNFWNVVVN